MTDASRYTKAADGGLIDVASVDPSDRYARGPYRCLSCGHVMVPALGRTRKHHFKHKAGRPQHCSDETYLHQLGKLTLFMALSEAIEHQNQFPLTRSQPMVCDYHEAHLGVICTSQDRVIVDDLTMRFDGVEMEEGIAGFIADILLTSTESGDVMLLEISVTHQSEQEKISSGLSIVEIQINSEDDIAPLKYGIDTTSKNVNLYNLPILEALQQRCFDPCNVTCSLFLLYDSGKAWYSHTNSANVAELTSDPRLVAWKIVDPRNSSGAWDQQVFIDLFKGFLVEQQIQHHREIRSCMLCQHNGGQINSHDIHCNDSDRRVWMSSSACSCRSYLPAEDAKKARLLLDENLRYLP